MYSKFTRSIATRNLIEAFKGIEIEPPSEALMG